MDTVACVNKQMQEFFFSETKCTISPKQFHSHSLRYASGLLLTTFLHGDDNIHLHNIRTCLGFLIHMKYNTVRLYGALTVQ